MSSKYFPIIIMFGFKRYGRRRPLFLIPMVGQILSDFMMAASVIWWRETSPEINAITETLPAALTGGRGV